MRVTAAFCRLLRLPGVTVRDVAFSASTVTVTVGLRRFRLVCPDCGFSTWARYDLRPQPSQWRHLDLGAWRLDAAWVWWRLARLGSRADAGPCPAYDCCRSAASLGRRVSRIKVFVSDWLLTVWA